jgi:hypothetical protein
VLVDDDIEKRTSLAIMGRAQAAVFEKAMNSKERKNE